MTGEAEYELRDRKGRPLGRFVNEEEFARLTGLAVQAERLLQANRDLERQLAQVRAERDEYKRLLHDAYCELMPGDPITEHDLNSPGASIIQVVEEIEAGLGGRPDAP
jgi:hypothetical protein